MFISNLFSKISSSEQSTIINNRTLSISFLQNSNIPSEDYDKYYQYHCSIIEKTEQLEKDPTIKNHFLSKYFSLEEELTSELNSIKNNKSHKQILRETLYNQFFKYDTSTRLKIQKQINTYFNKYLCSINTQRDLKQYFHINFDGNDFNKNEYENTKLNIYLKEMKHGIIDECISYIMSNIKNIEQIPNFLINKKLIKQKVNLIWKINYSIPTYQLKLEKSYAYQYLNQQCLNFLENKFDLFPIETYTKENLQLLIEVFFLSNIYYIHSVSKARNVFLTKLPYYITIMNLDQMNFDLRNSFMSKLNTNSVDKTNIENEKESKFNLLKNNLISNPKIDLNAKGNENILLLIFSFVIMLTNILVINNNDRAETKLIIHPKLICSSVEKRFLYNILVNIDKYIICNTDKSSTNSALYVDVFIESTILKNIFKTFCTSIFDESSHNKIELNQNTIITNITNSFETQTNIDYIKEKYFSFLNKFTNKEKKKFIHSNDQHFVNVKLIPNDPYKISNHITIVISSEFDDAIINQLNSYNKNIDYYFYKWNNLDNNQKDNLIGILSSFVSTIKISNNMKKTSLQLAGEFLAFILLTQTVFSFQTISLIGIGKGCEIIIHCIEMIYTLNQDIDLISDLLFINGNYCINGPTLVQIEKVITGNVYNVYTSCSNKENNINTNTNKFILKHNKIVYNRWENLDVNHLYLDLIGYQFHLNDIIEKLNFH